MRRRWKSILSECGVKSVENIRSYVYQKGDPANISHMHGNVVQNNLLFENIFDEQYLNCCKLCINSVPVCQLKPSEVVIYGRCFICVQLYKIRISQTKQLMVFGVKR